MGLRHSSRRLIEPKLSLRLCLKVSYKLVAGRRGVEKIGHKWDNFGLCWCGWQTVGSASDEELVLQCREQARQVHYAAVFDAKKEIPADVVRGHDGNSASSAKPDSERNGRPRNFFPHP
jgi:hypothetical protein